MLSHMYPRPELPMSGPFVHEQVRALREFAGIDARIVTCRGWPLNCFKPRKACESLQTFFNLKAALRWQDWDGVPSMYLPFFAGGLVRRWLFGRTYRHAVMRAASWIARDFSPDLVHAHTAYLDGGAALGLARRWRIPFTITEHTGPFTTLTAHPLIRRWTHRSLAAAARVWCVSDSLADEVRAFMQPRFASSVRTLANGVDTRRFHLKTGVKPDPHNPRLLAVMTLNENKNPLLLLEAVRRLRAQVPGARLTLVGRGPLEATVRETIQHPELRGAVTLRDFGPREEIARLMREECDLLVLTSQCETFGVVLIEALASGKPVVATRCGGPESIIRHPWLGRLCNPNDVDALRTALAAVIANLATFDGGRIHAYAAEEFEYRVLARRLEQGYRQILSETYSGRARGPAPASAEMLHRESSQSIAS